MTKEEKETLGFQFQEIPLAEALNVAMVGDGNYAEISAHLLEVLPQIDEKNAALGPKDKRSFAFGLGQNKEVSEAQRRGLIATVNPILKKAGLAWRVTYSGKKKLFICIPKGPKAVAGQTKTEYVPKSPSNKFNDAEIIKLRREGHSVPAIARMLPEIPIARIRYVCYQVMLGNRPGPKPDDSGRVKAFIDICREVFKTSDFKSRALRRAMSVVGVNTLGLSPTSLAPYLGIKNDGIWFNARKATSTTGAMEIQKLTEAVKGVKHV